MKYRLTVLIYLILISCRNSHNDKSQIEDLKKESTYKFEQAVKLIEYKKIDSVVNGYNREVSVLLNFKKDKYILILKGKPYYSSIQDSIKKTELKDSSFNAVDIKLYKVIPDGNNKEIKFRKEEFHSINIRDYLNVKIDSMIQQDIIFTDYNLDNFPDISFYCDHGTGGYIYNTWVYKPSINEYVFEPILSEYNNGIPDSINKTITMMWRYGYGDNRYYVYRVEGEKFIPIKTIYETTDSLCKVTQEEVEVVEEKKPLLWGYVKITDNEEKGIREVLDIYGGQCYYANTSSNSKGHEMSFGLEISNSKIKEKDSIGIITFNIAYTFYKNLKTEKSKYDDINPSIIFSNGEKLNYGYSTKLLEVVENRMRLVNKVFDLIKCKSYDSIFSILNNTEVFSYSKNELIEDLKRLDTQYGEITEGFRTTGISLKPKEKGKKILHISGSLMRGKIENKLSIDLDYDGTKEEIYLLQSQL